MTRSVPMAAVRWGMLGLAIIGGALSSQVVSAGPPDAQARDVAALAERIDQAMAAKWAANGVKPTHAADDAEFLRRVCLDLVGRIPNVADTHDFLADRAAHKRDRLVHRLLGHPRYVLHF